MFLFVFYLAQERLMEELFHNQPGGSWELGPVRDGAAPLILIW